MATYNGNTVSTISSPANGDIVNFDYLGSGRAFTLPIGTWKIECWGAQGASGETSGEAEVIDGGHGAYTKGIITLSSAQLFYFYIGSQAGWNGGGTNGSGTRTNNGGNGGGASDIRLSTALTQRIIVAGGGGGSGGTGYSTGGYYTAYGGYGGSAGKLIGDSGGRDRWSRGGPGTGGNQSAGGTCTADARYDITGYTSPSYPGGGGGGGGGYYGGAGGQGGTRHAATSNLGIAGNSGSSGSGGKGGNSGNGSSSGSYPLYNGGAGGGGGSSYISGYSGCVNHSSGTMFTETQMIAGNESMPNPRNAGNITGNIGNGYIRATLISGAVTVPVITVVTDPTAQSKIQGHITGNISVVASVSPTVTLTYQWYQAIGNNNTTGSAVSGATNSTFSIPTTLTVGIHYYYCIISAINATPVRSNQAAITITVPIISITTQPDSQIQTLTQISGNLSVVASCNPSQVLSYQWYQATGDNNTTGTAILNETTESFIIPKNLSLGKYYYYCMISSDNGAISVKSNPATITVTALDYYYFLTDGLTILDPNILDNINNITLNSLIAHGKYQEEVSGNNIQSFLFASNSEKIDMKIISQNQIIYNSDEINISNIQNIWQIKINGHFPLKSNILYLINNRDSFYSYKFNKWYKVDTQFTAMNLENSILNFGMTTDEIANISSEAWIEIYPNYEKYISFIALIIADDFNITPVVNSITVNYDSYIHTKRKVQNNLYTIKNKVTSFEITWNTSSKHQIEVIVLDKKEKN